MWGEWDCCLFSNSLIQKITGEDLIPKTLTWKDEASAKKSIKKYGGTLLKSIEKACVNKGVLEVDKMFVTKGDLVVYKEKTNLVGICDGMNVLSPSTDGIEVKPTELIVKAWRING